MKTVTKFQNAVWQKTVMFSVVFNQITTYDTSHYRQSKKIELSDFVIELDLWSESQSWNLCSAYC